MAGVNIRLLVLVYASRTTRASVCVCVRARLPVLASCTDPRMLTHHLTHAFYTHHLIYASSHLVHDDHVEVGHAMLVDEARDVGLV
jgi:hypothetical protein